MHPLNTDKPNRDRFRARVSSHDVPCNLAFFFIMYMQPRDSCAYLGIGKHRRREDMPKVTGGNRRGTYYHSENIGKWEKVTAFAVKATTENPSILEAKE